MNIYSMFDVPALNNLISKGFISRRTHPHLDLVVLHYTNKTVQERHWNSITTRCAGLIIDSQGEVVGNCLPKYLDEDIEENFLSACIFDEELILAYCGFFESKEITTARKIVERYSKRLLGALPNDSTAIYKPVLIDGELEGINLMGSLANYELSNGRQLWKPADELPWPIV